MQTRRPLGVTPLAIVLPHPSLPRRRSSLLSAGSSPRTPRSCGSPTCSSIFFSSGNRKSTDSWNSSNQDVADDLDWEWKPEQTLLLSRTLDALPAHLVTPFNDAMPPSNLLDKIARGVSQAKGDWPHSIRATRVKLLELARVRAKEESLAAQHRKVIAEEDDIEIDGNYSYFGDSDVLQQTTNIGIGKKSLGIGIELRPRRPLYRQSSMDFLNTTATDLKDNDTINRLSNRLQRTDRLIPNPAYHPYSRTTRARAQTDTRSRNRSSSPPRPLNIPSLISPSTPSSSTLNSLSSISAASYPRVLRRSASILSTTTTTSSSSASDMKNTAEAYPYLLSAMAPDPRVQRVRRSESFCAPSNSNPSAAPRQAFKRAPSFGALAQGVRENKNRDIHSADTHNNSYPSSDEEEKIRSRQAKRPRTKTSGSSSGVAASPPTSSGPSSPATSPISARTRTKTPPVFVCTEAVGKASVKSPKASPTSNSKSGSGSGNSKNADVIGNGNKPSRPSASAKPKMNLQRNPSIFGGELPHLHINIPVQVQPSQSLQQPRTPVRMLPPSHPNPMAVVATQKVMKTLRRVRRLAPARRISFGSLVPPADGDDADVEGEGEEEGGLGSAFQLQ